VLILLIRAGVVPPRGCPATCGGRCNSRRAGRAPPPRCSWRGSTTAWSPRRNGGVSCPPSANQVTPPPPGGVNRRNGSESCPPSATQVPPIPLPGVQKKERKRIHLHYQPISYPPPPAPSPWPTRRNKGASCPPSANQIPHPPPLPSTSFSTRLSVVSICHCLPKSSNMMQ